MCEQCSAATLTYGEPVPGVALIQATRDGLSMKKGQWGLVICNDPFIIFDAAPVLDPAHDMTDEEIDATDDTHPMWPWLTAADSFRSKLLVSPRVGFEITTEAIKLGFTNDDGDLSHWLFHRMGEVVAANPNPPNDNPKHF